MIQKAFRKSDLSNQIKIWGFLYVDFSGKSTGGWVVNSWATPAQVQETLSPRLFWFSQGKFYNMHFDESRVVVGEEATVEPERETFMLVKIADWYGEWEKYVQETPEFTLLST